MWFHFFTERDFYLFIYLFNVYCTETSEQRLMIWMCVKQYRIQALERNVCVRELEREGVRGALGGSEKEFSRFEWIE